jgi:hypothetical protein
MAEKPTVVETPKDTNALIVEAIGRLAESQAKLAENQPRRKKAFHEIVHDTPWWDGKSPRSVLTVEPFYQNGNPVNPDVLSNDEIDLINQLEVGVYGKTKDGKNVFRVTKMPGGATGLWYDNKSLKQRFAIARMAGEDTGLVGILRKILTEQEAKSKRRYDE